MISKKELSEVNSGITRLVKLLNENNFNTIDSGDGHTNVNLGMECAWDVPNVSMAVSKKKFFTEVERLYSLMNLIGITWNPEKGIMLQADYTPHDELCFIHIVGVKDSDIDWMVLENKGI